MDPLTVLTTLWRHKRVTVPIVLLTMLACLYVYIWAPRSYEASISFALTAPNVPSNLEIQRTPDLANLNSNNPYLRSNDSSLLTQVVIAKLSDPVFVDQLKSSGLGTDFKIAPLTGLGTGLVTVTATSSSEDKAVSTAKSVGEQFTSTLYSVQKVDGADDRYLYSPILVRGPGPATELFSSRLRSLIMIGIAGSVLLFGAVSVARARAIRSRRSDEAEEEAKDSAARTFPALVADSQETRKAQTSMGGRRSAKKSDTPSTYGPGQNALHRASLGSDSETNKDTLITAGNTAPDK